MGLCTYSMYTSCIVIVFLHSINSVLPRSGSHLCLSDSWKTFISSWHLSLIPWPQSLYQMISSAQCVARCSYILLDYMKEAEYVTEHWRGKHHFIHFSQTLKENKGSAPNPFHVVLYTLSPLIKNKDRIDVVQTLNVFALISCDHWRILLMTCKLQ